MALLFTVLLFTGCAGSAPEDSKGLSVGDIVMSDGSFLKSNKYSSYEGKAIPVGIVCMVNDDGESGLMLGLKNSGEYTWAKAWSKGYETKFTEIVGDRWNKDKDGSDNFDAIRRADKEGAENAAINYPAFFYAENYGSLAGLEETKYAKDWYMPSCYELYNYVYENREKLDKSLAEVKGSELSTYTFWTSNQCDSDVTAWYVQFYDGFASACYKNTTHKVCCIRKF